MKGVFILSISFRKEISKLEPYKPGKPIEDVKREFGIENVIKLASNENPLGCSPLVKDAILKELDEIAIYPDGNATKLKEVLASKLNISSDQILPSSGLDEMIDMVSKTYLSHEDEVIMADITFPRYAQTAEMMGAKSVFVPLVDFTTDLNGMIDKITDKTKIIWVCNPNNPTGTMITENDLVSFLDKIPSNILVISDEAYREYVSRDDYPHNSVALLDKYPNLLIMRTFSKAYGLAGIRVGYTIGSKEITEAINRVRGPFNVNSLAQMGAIAALEDTNFLKKVYDMNLEGKLYLYEEFKNMGLDYEESETNHIFVNAKRNAGELFLELQKRGVIIRPMGGDFIRVSIGTMEENQIFIKELKDILA